MLAFISLDPLNFSSAINFSEEMLSARLKKGRFRTSCLWHPSIQETRSFEDLSRWCWSRPILTLCCPSLRCFCPSFSSKHGSFLVTGTRALRTKLPECFDLFSAHFLECSIFWVTCNWSYSDISNSFSLQNLLETFTIWTRRIKWHNSRQNKL